MVYTSEQVAMRMYDTNKFGLLFTMFRNPAEVIGYNLTQAFQCTLLLLVKHLKECYQR